MNEPAKTTATDSEARQTPRPANESAFRWRAVTIAVGLIAGIGVWIYATLANAQQPVLTIADFGGNQFSITVTNGVTNNNYTLYWTPAVNDLSYPWVVLTNSAVGESNFMVDAGEWPSGFFKVLLGSDADGDGVPEWLDAQPQNPNVGILSVTIDSPTNGMVFQ